MEERNLMLYLDDIKVEFESGFKGTHMEISLNKD